MTEVWDTTLPKAPKFLLLAMADYANDNGAGIYPGRRRLAERTSDSERNVRRLLAQLEDLGLIEPVAYRLGGHGKTTHWRINLEEVRRHQRGQNGPLPPVDNPAESVDNPVGNSVDNSNNEDTTRELGGHHPPPNRQEPKNKK